ncbi:MAG: lysophospholipid acyltransferase family protein [Nitrospirota bacterium]
MALFLEYLFYISLARFLSFLPHLVSLKFGEFLGVLLFTIDRKHRGYTINNLRMSLGGEKTETELREIAKGSYANLGRNFAEFSRFLNSGTNLIERYVRIDGFENYLNAKAKGKGVIFLTGHCGNWELMALAQSKMGEPLSVIGRPMDNPYLDRLINKIRATYGNRTINKRGAIREMLRTLKEGGVIGILLDENTRLDEGVFVDFFGIPACTNRGFANIILKTGAPVVPAFINYEGKGHHRVVYSKELEIINIGNREKDVIENTALFTRVIENHIRKYPDQWLWMLKRWKTRPAKSESESEK